MATPDFMKNVTVLSHRSLRVLFSVIRDKRTEASRYITYCDRLCNILAEEGLAYLPTVTEVEVETPCGTYKGLKVPDYTSMCAVSIMRSGDILLEAVRRVAHGIAVGKVLVQRDEDTPEKKAKLFYSKLPPDIKNRQVLLVDPMIATGGSVIKTLEVLISAGVPQENIIFLNVVSVPEGLAALFKSYPKVKVITAALDKMLNNDKYIVPGLGDFGDRYYST